MTGALLYLLLCTARNRVLRQLRRVREPRYAVALLVGLGYLWLVLLRRGRPDPLAGAAAGDSALLASSVGVALLVAPTSGSGCDRRRSTSHRYASPTMMATA